MIPSIIVITLLVLLATRELAGVSDSESAQRIASFSTVPIVSLIILFVVIVALSITKALT